MTSADVEGLLRETGALLSGHFRLSSGLHSGGYVQCARVLEHPRNAKVLGRMLAERCSGMNIERIVSPALGGVVIGYAVAEAMDVPMVFTERKDGVMSLRRGFELSTGRRVAIIEDVVTTGKSTRETAEVVESQGGEVVAFGSILNRTGSGNPFDRPFHALHTMNIETFESDACSLCAAGVPIDAPGSRFQGAK